MIGATIVFLIVIMIFAFLKYRDAVCPAVLHNLFWIISLLGALSMNRGNNWNSLAMMIIIAGSILFQLGFSFSLRATWGPDQGSKKYLYGVNSQMLKLLVILIIICSLSSLYQYFVYMGSSSGTIYSMLTMADENLSLPAYFSHFRKIVGDISLAFLAIYWTMEKEERRSIRKYIYALMTIALLFVASVPSRNSVLSYVLPLLILFVCTHNISNGKVLLLGTCSVFGFMLLFYAISLGKYWYMYESASDSMSVLTDEIKVYLSGSIIAFGNTFSEHAYMYCGKNTFRFFIAVSDALFETNSALKLTNEFVSISGLRTNVYTFYDFYIRDFGVMYALFAQFIVSCIHGRSYKGMMNGRIFPTYFFAMLSYPLVMQFFQDQYCSLLSTWIQIALVGIIIFKTNIFISEIPSREDD